MMTAEVRLKFIRARVESLRDGAKPHKRAVYTAPTRITELRDQPHKGPVSRDLALAELSRHITTIQHNYRMALIGDSK